MHTMNLQGKMCRKFSLDSSCYTVEGVGRLRKPKGKSRFEPRKVDSLEEAHLQIQELNKSLNRQTPNSSQNIDERGFERSEGDLARNSFIKHNKTFHKIFLDIPESEELTHSFTCALQKEVLYQGKLFVSDNYVCFYSSVLLKDTRVVIHVSNVQAVKKQNTARLVPNALSIHNNEGEKYLFVSLRNREACYKLLCSVCPNMEKSGQSSPVVSSAENSIDPGKDTNTSESSLEDSLDPLDDRDSSVQLKSPLSRLLRTSRTRESSSTSTDKDDSSSDENTDQSWIWSITEKAKSFLILRESNNFNNLLIIYVLLVLLLLLTSGYIGLRIMALEEQLSSMGALPEFSLQSGHKDTSDFGQGE
ncbi:GRAM domain-containing protein 2B-like isoform X2 [Conger conger]|uniref:GRAM domain-containing protein 2B-like isoform X2 n=1 Tax=Conger conger TaxID=82655 RepID=UPI002A5AC178|nr:GRAM domain-containing protein 2B-like isoform X2 [Conger conger]